MNKEERIKKYGEAAYEKKLQQKRDWQLQHRKEANAYAKKWKEANPDKVKANGQEIGRKGGKYYAHMRKYHTTGLQGGRNRIRSNHWYMYRAINQATPNSQIHHEWIPGTVKYRGVALVEKEAHQNGVIKVIKILEGKITLFTEYKVRTSSPEGYI